jgi:hypothetical protein
MANYQFTNNWFGANHQLFVKHLSKFNDQKVNVLEVGCFEGRSTTWLVDNVLGHPESTLVAIDPFLTDDPTSPVDNTTYDRFKHNISQSSYPDKVSHFQETGEAVYPLLVKGTYDLSYIDACHLPWNILHDMCNVWNLLKIGGTMVCDDYGSDNRFNTRFSPNESMKYFITNVLKGRGYQIHAAEWALLMVKTADFEFKDEQLTLDYWKRIMS